MFEARKNILASKEIIIGGVTFQDRLVLVQHLHAGIRAGYSLADTLQLALSQSRGRMKQVLHSVLAAINNGAYLYEALSKFPKYFPLVFINLIKTGELSSSLEGSLSQLDSMLRKESEFSQKIRSASIYPIFVFVAILGLALTVSFFVLPNILPLFQSLDTELPRSTRILLWFAQTFATHGVKIFWGLATFSILLAWLVKQNFSKPVTHWLILHVPLFGKLYRKIIMTRFSRTMHSLLKNGITIDQALASTASSIQNIHYQNAIRSIMPYIAKGDTLSESLKDHKNLFENLFIDMLTLGEKTGSLEEAFANITEYYELQVDHQAKNLITSLEPILLIVVGLLVGFVAISILGPIYSISGSIR